MNAIRRTPPGAWTALLLLVALAAPAPAAQRVALVVGNAAYEHTVPLSNPRNDATDVARALRSLDFEVIEGLDLDKRGFETKLRAFARAARGAEATLFFYAGHGLQVEGRNYLVPTDAKLADEVDLRLDAFELEAFLGPMRSTTNLVFLDACRDNPLANNLARSMGPTRSAAVGRGLGRVETGSGTLIAYATQPGNVADDGEGRNSPFTEALLAHIATPGLGVDALLARVTDDVMRGTGERQQPWRHSSLRKPFYFVRAPALAAPAVSVSDEADEAYAAAKHLGTVAAFQVVVDRFPGTEAAERARARVERLAVSESPMEVELLFWESVKDSPHAVDIRAYLDRYPDGTFEVLARNRLKRLEGGSAAPGTPAPAPVAPTPEDVESSLVFERDDRRLIQRGLASLGWEPGLADGLFGPRTRGAIRGYQEAKGFEATGYLTAEQSQALLALGDEEARARAKSEAERREAQRREAQQREEERREAERREAQRRAEPDSEEAQRRAKSPGRRFRDCEECPWMVVVPAGSFMMGSPSGEAGRDRDEGPVHRVRIAEAFAVGVYEVTFEEWGACRHGGGCSHNPHDQGWGRGNRPVMNVSWEDVQQYVRWLSRETGERYRLPSEAEWEYVARAGTETSYHWGDAIGRNRANCRGCGSRQEGGQTSPVGSFSPNAFGLHDVHGNVWEWVEDCWDGGYSGAPRDGGASTPGGDCSRRVLRGGSWINEPGLVRSANRYWFTTGVRDSFIGFRVARTLD